MLFASDTADPVHQTRSRKLGDDQVVSPLAIELDQVELVDAEIAVTRPKRVPHVRNLIGVETIRYGERQQEFSWLGRNR